MAKSRIEWTESTWNPVTGCTKVSEGCANCYAERMARRLQAMGQKNYRNGFKVTCHDHLLGYPLHWKKPRMVFVNSMSDLFHESVPDEFIFQVFEVMRKAHWHAFQILTKRDRRLRSMAGQLEWSPNVWMGVTVENQRCTYRIDALQRTPAAVKFLSLEPLLTPIPSLTMDGIDWVIVGGESGPGARPMEKQWVEDIRDQCLEHAIPFFFKQWGGVNKKATGRRLNGRTYDQMPQLAIA
mgnify:CR=1 FL=1